MATIPRNVIVVLIDTLRRDHVEAYGQGPVPTPGFRALAELGTTFDHFFLASFPCMPARRDLWTGRYEFPWRGWGPLAPEDRDLPSVLSDHGIVTALVTDHYHLFQPGSGNYHFGFRGWEFIRGQEDDHWKTTPVQVPWPQERGVKLHRRFEQYWRNTVAWRDGLSWAREEDTFAARTFRAAAAWLRENASGPRPEPFFLMIDCFDPHEPFDPPRPWREVAGAPPPDAPEAISWPIYGTADRYTPEEMTAIRRLYAGEVALVDRWFGEFLEEVRRLGRLSDTAILLTTDHGYLFGEHGMVGKPSTVHGDSNLYRALAHVPLIVYHPDAPGAGARCAALAQMVDLYPTILDLMGVDVPAGAVHGRSLVPLLLGDRTPVRPYACYGKFGEAIQITDGTHVLHQWPPGQVNAPLYWYGWEPPRFLRPRAVGGFDPARGAFPVDWERGPMHTCLLDREEKGDLSAALPHVRAALQAALRDWLKEVGAPEEQSIRLGL